MTSRILLLQVGLGGRGATNGPQRLIRPKEGGELITLVIAQEFFKDVASN